MTPERRHASERKPRSSVSLPSVEMFAEDEAAAKSERPIEIAHLEVDSYERRRAETSSVMTGWFYMTKFRIGPFAVIALLGFSSPIVAENEPGPENDYGRAVISGSRGPIVWESLLHEDGLDGWAAEGAPWDTYGLVA